MCLFLLYLYISCVRLFNRFESPSIIKIYVDHMAQTNPLSLPNQLIPYGHDVTDVTDVTCDKRRVTSIDGIHREQIQQPVMMSGFKNYYADRAGVFFLCVYFLLHRENYCVILHTWTTIGTMNLCSLGKCLHLAVGCCTGAALRSLSCNDHRVKLVCCGGWFYNSIHHGMQSCTVI